MHTARSLRMRLETLLDSEVPYGPAGVIDEVVIERAKQDAKWGEQNHGPMVWLGILAEEFGEAAREANDYHFKAAKGTLAEIGARYRAELVQAAAVAVAMIESYDRNEGTAK